MTSYTESDIYFGAGILDSIMGVQTEIPVRSTRMSPGLAVGILSSAMRGGLSADQIGRLIELHFADSAALLRCMLDLYEGSDWSTSLWRLQPTGRYKLCTELCRPGLLQWRYDPSISTQQP